MQCVSCGAETEAGASLTFFYSTRARSRGGILNTEPAADQVLGIEEVFLCFLCQIAARHRAARKAALICGMLIGFALAVVGLTLFPSFFPAGSRFGAFLLSVPVVGMVDLLGNLVGLGILARSFIDAFGECIWDLCSWRKPYALSGVDPDLNKTAGGEAFAIALRRAALKQQGYHAFFTRKAYCRWRRSTWISRRLTYLLDLVGLLALGLLVLVLLAMDGFLVGAFH